MGSLDYRWGFLCSVLHDEEDSGLFSHGTSCHGQRQCSHRCILLIMLFKSEPLISLSERITVSGIKLEMSRGCETYNGMDFK